MRRLKRGDIEARLEELSRIASDLEQQLRKAPEGTVWVRGKQGHYKYYWWKPDMSTDGCYLNRGQRRLRDRLAQKRYTEEAMRAVEQEVKAWKTLLERLPEKRVEDVYDGFLEALKPFVSPVGLTEEEYRTRWESVQYEPGWFKPGTPEFWTDRGERVRSKSEQLIANLLYRLGIPYRYEYPIEVTVNGRRRQWRPDFMILDSAHRKVFFLEHFGMMDDDDYARNAMGKMAVYEQNGLYEGCGMYYTFETKGSPLDMRYVEAKVQRILSCEDGGVPASLAIY